jgi:hypothetical protein
LAIRDGCSSVLENVDDLVIIIGKLHINNPDNISMVMLLTTMHLFLLMVLPFTLPILQALGKHPANFLRQVFLQVECR